MRPSYKITKNSSSGQSLWVGYALGALGASFFATKGIVIKLALIENVDALTTLTWRMIIAVPFFIIIGLTGLRDRQKKGHAAGRPFKIKRAVLVKTIILGMLGYYLASYLDFAGLEYISAQFDRLILLTNPFFVVLFGAILFGRRVTWQMIAALLVSYLGLAFIFAYDFRLEGNDVILGAALVLGAAIAYALYQLLAKPLIDEIGARLFTSIAMSSAGLVVIVHFLIANQIGDLLVSGKAMWLMAAMGTVSTVLPAYLIAASIGRIGSEPTAVMGNVSPLVTIFLAVFILQETFSIWHAAGAALVLLGMFAFTSFERQAKRIGN